MNAMRAIRLLLLASLGCSLLACGTLTGPRAAPRDRTPAMGDSVSTAVPGVLAGKASNYAVAW